ncbi:hypothetical protein SEA_FEDE_25 [Microbacterium phage Fede]|nr:hypothetical protein SEA_FEDE_25 [Microbacterium phage Fede]
MSHRLNKHCLNCGAQIVINIGNDTRENGNVYSEAGRREVDITGYCETCFDNITRPPDEPEEHDRDWKEYYEQRMVDEEYAKDRFSDLVDDVPDEHDDRL